MTWWQKKPFIDAIQAYDKVSDREQKIVLATITVVLVLLGYLLLIEPLLLLNKSFFDEQNTINKVNHSLSLQIKKTREKQYQDPNEPLRSELQQLEERSKNMHNKINLLTQALVAPKEMVRLLEKMLLQDKQLKLVSLRNLPEQAMDIHNNSVQEPSAEIVNNRLSNVPTDLKEAREEALIYKHGFEIELEATYASTVAYLKRLDDLPWQLFWQTLEYESTAYPKGKLKIHIYTLSTSKEVLGV
mgnify:CR=1 FL=1